MAGYCQGCNEQFTDAVRDCPLCGGRLTDPPTASTAELDRDATSMRRLQRPEPPDLSGNVLGKYEVETLIGRGGMSRVYRARHLTLERTCALKVLTPRTVQEESDWTPMFLREARSAAGLVHPNVVTVHDINRSGDLHFIEMEYVEGATLGDFVRQRGPLDPLLAGRYLRQIAGALAHAHERGLVHRDVKPSNVLVTAGGQAKLSDFGLARTVVPPLHSEGVAPLAGNTIAGTPYFMSPELFEGAPATPRSDVYAAGVTLYFLLTASLPFQSESLPDLIAQHRHLDPPDPRELRRDIPEPIVDLMRRCLAKRPEDRFEDAHELSEALRAVIGRLRSLEELVATALEQEDLHWSAKGAAIEVTVPLPAGREQRVKIEELVSELDDEPLVRISSPCAPLEEKYCRRALELNSESHHGAIAVHDFEGELHFVARSSYPRSTCDPEEVRGSVYAVARLADRVERALTGDDRH